MRQSLMNSLSFEKIPILSVFCKSGIDRMFCFVFLRAQNRDFSISFSVLWFHFILKPFHTSQQAQLLFCLQETQNSYSIPEKNLIFLSLSDTSPCSEYKLLLSSGDAPHSSLGADPLLHLLLKTFESSQALVEANLNHLACILSVKPVKPGSWSIKHSSGGFLDLGCILESTREVCWGKAQVKWKCHSFASTCSGHVGTVISRL